MTPQINHLGKMSPVLRVSLLLLLLLLLLCITQQQQGQLQISYKLIMKSLLSNIKRPIMKQISFTPTCSEMADLCIYIYI